MLILIRPTLNPSEEAFDARPIPANVIDLSINGSIRYDVKLPLSVSLLRERWNEIF